MVRYMVIVALFAFSVSVFAENEKKEAAASAKAPVKIILDTDIGGDIDDLGALAILNVLADKGECEILAVMSCTARKKAVDAIDVVNTYFGRPDTPVGHHDGKVSDWEPNYCEFLADSFKHDLKGENAPDATGLYRKILSAQPDNSVVIISIGGLRNLYNLMNSKPDDISSLDGKGLISKKVGRIVTMGGTYPSSGKGAEPNFQWCGKGYAKFVVDNFPRPQIFSGSEIGLGGYRTGTKLNSLPDESPIKAGYLYFMKHPPKWAGGPFDRITEWPTYDQCAVIVGVRGGGEYFEEVKGYNKIDDDGKNEWQASPARDQGYLKEKMKAKTFADTIIEPLMVTLPKK